MSEPLCKPTIKNAHLLWTKYEQTAFDNIEGL